MEQPVDRSQRLRGELRVGEWLVQPSLDRIAMGSRSVHVRPGMMDVLAYLARHADPALAKDDIIAAVWGRRSLAESVLTRTVTELRQPLEDRPGGPRYIETITKRGSSVSRSATLVLLLLAALLAPGARAEEPTETALLEAWEAAQRADPKVVVLEKIGENRYRFETTRFPFKGELQVLTLNLEDVELPGSDAAVMGIVEVELIDAPADLAVRHSVSYGSWHSGNVMYFDRKAGRWLTTREWQRGLQDLYSPWKGLLSLGNMLFIGLLVLLVVVLLRTSRKAGTQMKTAMAAQERALADQRESLAMMKRSLELAEESTRLLREIRDDVKARGTE